MDHPTVSTPTRYYLVNPSLHTVGYPIIPVLDSTLVDLDQAGTSVRRKRVKLNGQLHLLPNFA